MFPVIRGDGMIEILLKASPPGPSPKERGAASLSRGNLKFLLQSYSGIEAKVLKAFVQWF